MRNRFTHGGAHHATNTSRVAGFVHPTAGVSEWGVGVDFITNWCYL